MNTPLTEQVRGIAEAAPPRTPARRAAAALHVALETTKTTTAARRALATVRDPATRAAALVLLDRLEQETT